VCVVQANIVYFMGGQFVFDWDRTQNFLITRHKYKMPNSVSHVQMQSTIAIVSDAQTEGKKCLLHLHLNHDCHAIIEKHITIPSQHLPS